MIQNARWTHMKHRLCPRSPQRVFFNMADLSATTTTPEPPSVTNAATTSSAPLVYGDIRLTLENCILPSNRLEKTPSAADGLDSRDEYELRLLGCELIQTGGILLRLPQVAMATAQVLFHRFYYSKSLVRYQYETLAMACVALASKIEEEPRRNRDVMNVFHHINQIRSGISPSPILIDHHYSVLKDQIIMAERRLLKELGFCVHVKHPHKFIVALLQALDRQKDKGLFQTAWNYMNDSLRTDLFVRHSPETIACSCLFLSARVLKIALPDDPPWFEVFGASLEEIESVCHAILKLYSCGKPDKKRLENRLAELKREYEQIRLQNAQANGKSTTQNIKSPIAPKEAGDEPSRQNETIDNSIKPSGQSSANVDKKHERHSSRSPDRRRGISRRRRRSGSSPTDERPNDRSNEDRSRYDSFKEDDHKRSDDRKRKRDRYRESERSKSHRTHHHGNGRSRDDYASRYSHRNDDPPEVSHRKHRDCDRLHQRRRRSTSRDRY